MSDLIDLLSHAEPRHLADIMTAATAAEEEREEERRRVEWAKRVEEAKELAPRMVDGIEKAGISLGQWLVEGKYDAPLMAEVITLWEKRRQAGGAGD